MKRLGFLLTPSLVVLAILGIVFGSGSAGAVTNADYAGTPPFIATVVAPNVLIMLDNSGSMGFRAMCDGTTNSSPYTNCPTSPQVYGVGAPASAPFVENVTFPGQFDPKRCYTYDAAAGNTRFVETTTKVAINTRCATTDWDGNFLNWVTHRRHDALVKALIGGTCAAPARLADASCPPIGTPPLITMQGVAKQLSSCCDQNATAPTLWSMTGAETFCTPVIVGGVQTNPSCAFGRIPNAVQNAICASPCLAAAPLSLTSLTSTLIVSSIAAGGTTTATVTTAVTHGYSTGDSVTIAGATLATTGYNGTYTVTTIPAGNKFTYTLGAAIVPSATGCPASCTSYGRTALATTSASHGYAVGAQVTIAGATPAGYSGDFLIAAVPSATTFTYRLASTQASPATLAAATSAVEKLTNIVMFTIPSTSGSLVAGGFCAGPSSAGFPSSSCPVAGLGEFLIHIAVSVEPLGAIQELGSQARFGLLEFRNSGDGGQVLVPIGWTTQIPYNSPTVTNFNSNLAAMVAGVESTSANTGTPLSETLYTGMRYFAQLPQPFGLGSYSYPCAFAGCGPSFPSASQTAGSLGKINVPASANEPSQLAAGDACVAGLGYLAGACGRDPYYFGSNPPWSATSLQVPCCKAFIMFLTDGESNSDQALPAALADYAHPAHGAHCSGNWAGGANPTAAAYTAGAGCFTSNTQVIAPKVLLLKHKCDYVSACAASDQNHSVDDIAYWGHINDLRQATIPVTGEAGHDLPGFQNVTTYPVFAFGNIAGRESLMQAAKQGGFIDQNGNNLPDLQSEWDQVDNVTGLLVPDGIPDTYFESQNATDMKDKILAALTSILQKAASGTSVSVLATSSTGEGAIYQAFFFPTTFVSIGPVTTQVAWTGFTQSLFIDKFGNLREDYSSSGCTGAPDGLLILTHDCIIKIRLDTNAASLTFGQVLVDRFKDDGTATGSTAGDGVADTATPFQTVTLTTGGVSNVQPLWEAGRQLALLNPGNSCESGNTWPIGTNMNQGGSACRRLLTWVDLSNGGGVGGGAGTETLEFATSNVTALCPYLAGSLVLNCNSAIPANKAAALAEATNIIQWMRGFSVPGLRDRTYNVLNNSGVQVQQQWKLGDIINSTPIIVGAPHERFDVIYGDATYSQFFARYKDRRQVSYVGGNDGMMHAFNAGFFQLVDGPILGVTGNVQARFTTTPKQPGVTTDCVKLPCDASSPQYNFRADAPPLGAELWAYIPQDLLPQLKWMTVPAYQHTYGVDLPAKVTDVRIFCDNSAPTFSPCVNGQGGGTDHPGGWGTILIGGFRFGGSCMNCAAGKGTPMVVNADFNGNGTTTDTGNSTGGSDYRAFLSSYFVMDITNPEEEPVLLWTFRDQNLGLTTAAPAVVRVNPATDGKTSFTNEKWLAVFGSGPTHFDAFTCSFVNCASSGLNGQAAQIYVVDIKQGPFYTSVNRSTGGVCPTTAPCINVTTTGSSTSVFTTNTTSAFMADMVSVDFNLDFRADAIYSGSVICNGTAANGSGCGGAGPVWTGAMWRLTTNGGDPNLSNWGIAPGTSPCPAGGGAVNCATKLLSTYVYTTAQPTTCTAVSPCPVGPISSGASLTLDDANNLWVFFGEGRFFNNADKTNTDLMHVFGIKDSFMTNASSSAQTVERNINLFNASTTVTCTSCGSGGNVSTTGSTSAFSTSFNAQVGVMLLLGTDGWFSNFTNPINAVLIPALPTMTAGERDLSTPTLIGGTLFFSTFTPVGDICQASGTGLLYAVFYQTGGPQPNAALGTTAVGVNTLANKSVSLGQGMPSQMAVQIGAQGSGTSGAASSSGCAGRITGFIQASTGVLGQVCGTSAFQSWSRIVSWRDL